MQLPVAALESVTVGDVSAVIATLIAFIGGWAGVRSLLTRINNFITIADRFETTAAEFKGLVDTVQTQGNRIGIVERLATGSKLKVGSLDALVKAILELQPEGILVADSTGKAIFVNTTLCRMVSRQKDDMLGDAWKDCLHETSRPSVERVWAELISGHRSSYFAKIALTSSEGTIRIPVHIRAARKRDDETEKVKILASFSPVNEVPHA